MKVLNVLRNKCLFKVYLLAGLLTLGGCASNEDYQAALANAQAVANNSRIVPANFDIAWSSVLDLAVQQGYTILQKDTKSKTVTLTKTIPNPKDADISEIIKPTITFVAVPDQQAQTRVFLFATKTTMDGKDIKNQDTVRTPDFYTDYFAKLSVKVTQKNKEAADAKAAADKKAKADAIAKEAAEEKAADLEVAAKAREVVAKAEARKIAEAEARRIAEEERLERARIAAERAKAAKAAKAKHQKPQHKSQKN